tara:strand:- start:1150 stop:1356 length:207 start_codon:yes stop_codon:yes gene_type:complete
MVAKIIKFPEAEEEEAVKCSICDCDFDMDSEGGTAGHFGIMPVAFCPWCLSSMFDMVAQMGGVEDSTE